MFSPCLSAWEGGCTMGSAFPCKAPGVALSWAVRAAGIESVPLGVRICSASQTHLCKYVFWFFFLLFTSSYNNNNNNKCRRVHFSLSQINTFLFLHFYLPWIGSWEKSAAFQNKVFHLEFELFNLLLFWRCDELINFGSPSHVLLAENQNREFYVGGSLDMQLTQLLWADEVFQGGWICIFGVSTSGDQLPCGVVVSPSQGKVPWWDEKGGLGRDPQWFLPSTWCAGHPPGWWHHGSCSRSPWDVQPANAMRCHTKHVCLSPASVESLLPINAAGTVSTGSHSAAAAIQQVASRGLKLLCWRAPVSPACSAGIAQQYFWSLKLYKLWVGLSCKKKTLFSPPPSPPPHFGAFLKDQVADDFFRVHSSCLPGLFLNSLFCYTPLFFFFFSLSFFTIKARIYEQRKWKQSK